MRLNRLVNSYRSPNARRGNVVAGCLIALAIVVVIIIIGAVWLAFNWKGLAAGLTVTGATEAINDSSLPDAEKPELIAIIEDFAGRFESGDISSDEFFSTLLEVMASDVFPIGNAYVADNGYIRGSGLTDEEKADGSVQMMRIAEGLYDGSIALEDFAAVFAPMQNTTQNARFATLEGDQVELIIFRDPSEVTDDELREVIASAQTLADDAGVSATPRTIDLSDALQAEIDDALAGETEAETAEAADPPADTETSDGQESEASTGDEPAQ
ncbi:MAG: hypothetical protein AAGH64_09280 [Planctomycetota bacterium]